VRGLSRHPKPFGASDPIQWLGGDAMDAQTVTDAATGTQLIVHALNPPGYKDWDKLVLPMIDNGIAAAKAAGARLLVPGNAYNFGPDAFPLANEASPQHPRTRKGAIRVEMERRLAQAGETGVRSTVVRAGDFFGGRNAASSMFAHGVVKAGQPLTAVSTPVERGAGHAWAYLPDLAQTVAALADRDGGQAFETYHFAGHFDPDATRMIAAVRAAAGRPDLPLKAFPWSAVMLASPFVTTLRELMEMRYLWRQTLQLDNAKLVRTLGAEPHTPWEEAVRATLIGLGCLPAQNSTRQAA
jgi:nucleoside-diphosphate-sugar epimerase